MRIIILFIIAASGLLYLPGIHGPLIFDDLTNITQNSLIQIEAFSFAALKNAALSSDAGPLGRPLANLSFALDYYFAGSFSPTTPYKSTNLFIHTLNGGLVFWFVSLLFKQRSQNSQTTSNKEAELVAGLLAIAWVTHPIAVTSVLYIVQRMTSLAALFTLLSLISYFYARQSATQHSWRVYGLYFASALCFVLGIYSKETALLIPVFIALMEYCLFSELRPWVYWYQLKKEHRTALLVMVLIACIGMTLFVITYALPGFANRPFSMTERILTELRVVVFYISLILFPVISNFGLFHDDIALSSSLVDPLSTLVALLFISALLVTAIKIRKQYRLISFGLLFFFAGHLLESTFFALEIVHEHRNYLPALGILIASVGVLRMLSQPKQYAILSIAIIVFSLTTWLRAQQWDSYDALVENSARHHPDSAISQSMLSKIYYQHGNLEQAYASAVRATELNPVEPTHRMLKLFIGAQRDIELSQQDQDAILDLLTNRPISSTTEMALQSFSTFDCFKGSCAELADFVYEWLTTATAASKDAKARSLFQFYEGKFLLNTGEYDRALASFNAAYLNDPIYLQPLFEIVTMYMASSQFGQADKFLNILIQANAKAPYNRDREIEVLSRNLMLAKNKASTTQ